MLLPSDMPALIRIAEAADNLSYRVNSIKNYEFSVNSYRTDGRNVNYLLTAVETDLEYLRNVIKALDKSKGV